MGLAPLPLTSRIEEYEQQAIALLDAWQAGDMQALAYFHRHLPRLKDSETKWLPRPLSEAELRAEVFNLEEARAAVAHGYDFADWEALSGFVAAIKGQEGEVFEFECAVDAVVGGDLPELKALLMKRPELVQARSTRVTHFDPPIHRATLLHYIAANGVENYRQKTPPNAVEIATVLLDAGADASSLASLYGGECTTMSLLVSSSHPAAAGVQVALVDLLVARGASLGERGSGSWVSPIETALVFGFRDTAEALLRHGAPVSLAAAAGLGRADVVRSMLPGSDELARHRALAIAAQSGEALVVEVLLDAGEDPDRYNPPGTHAHTPPIHQAVWGGHLNVVRLLVERGAHLDIRDKIHKGTPLGWARYGGRAEIAAYLESKGAI